MIKENIRHPYLGFLHLIFPLSYRFCNPLFFFPFTFPYLEFRLSTLPTLDQYTPFGSSENLIFDDSWSCVVPKVLFEISLIKQTKEIKKCLPDKTLEGAVTYYENLKSNQKARYKNGEEINSSTLEDFHAWIQTPEGQEKNPTMHTILNNYESYKQTLGDDFYRNYEHFQSIYLNKKTKAKSQNTNYQSNKKRKL